MFKSFCAQGSYKSRMVAQHKLVQYMAQANVADNFQTPELQCLEMFLKHSFVDWQCYTGL